MPFIVIQEKSKKDKKAVILNILLKYSNGI
jgi:hypothetical protein